MHLKPLTLEGSRRCPHVEEGICLQPRSGLPECPAWGSCPVTPSGAVAMVGWAPAPLPGCSLLGAALSALGRAAVVPDEAAKAHGHSCVAVVHGHHGHLFSRRPVGQAQAADVGLSEEKAQGGVRVTSPPVSSAVAPTPTHAPARGGVGTWAWHMTRGAHSLVLN